MRAAALLLLLAWPATALADSSWYPERRKAQSQKNPGHLAVPYLINLPGIGTGYGALGAATNIGGTSADVLVSLLAGDIGGVALGVDDLHLIPEHLILEVGGAYLSRTAIESYNQRGMASDREDSLVAEFRDSFYGAARATASFLDRRLEAYVGLYGGEIELAAIRGRDGEVIVEAQGAPPEWFHTWIFGVRLDFTDDKRDPRRGTRFEAGLARSPASGSGPDFWTVNYSLSAYLPLGPRSTWAFNYFRSDAEVLHTGETDVGLIAAELGLDCDVLEDSRKRQECRRYVETIAAENRYGSASSLGGLSRLRSFPQGRYAAAHTQFAGSELRWNLTDEKTPFDIFFVKDIRTAVQVALFYEIGTAADTEGELWEQTRDSCGLGLRIVTASGLVYRVDLAAGREGLETSVFFLYPWDL